MIHQSQGLAFRLEAGDHLPCIHARFEDLEGDLAPHRLMLLRHEDEPETAFADLLQELVRADHRARGFALGDTDGGRELFICVER